MPDRSVSLPPMPDASGEPRPPAAPRILGPLPSAEVQHFDASAGRRFAEGENTTEEERARHTANPVLERVVGPVPPFLDHARSVLRVAAGPVVVLLGLGGAFVVTVLGAEPGITFLGLGLTAALILGFLLLIGLSGRAPLTAQAGARILEGRHGEKVWLYELSGIAVKDGKLRLAGGFEGQKSGWMSPLPLDLLESNPRLWDLVYNGLRHSAAAGAEVDPHTRELLRLP